MSWPDMGVDISPERGERAERAVGGRPERIPEPGTEVLVGRTTEADGSSGRGPGAPPPLGYEPSPWSGGTGTATAAPPSLTRTAPTRAFFFDGPDAPDVPDDPPTERLPSATPDPGGPSSAPGDPSGAPADGRDPREVTVRLDRARLPADGSADRPGKDVSAGAEASDRPVFVDASGRRSRRYRRLGMAVAVVCAVYAVVIVATLLSGNSNAPWLPVPGQEEDTPAGQVETSPRPTQSVHRTGPGGATAPVGRAGAAGGTTASTGSTATTRASASATATGASGDPKPSPSVTKKPNPGVSTGITAPGTRPSATADGQPSAPATATTPAGTATPTETAGTPGSEGAGPAPNG